MSFRKNIVTMYLILCVFVLAVLHGATSEDCVPDPVEGLQLDVNSTLHWRASTNCDHTSYIIYILFEENIEHIHQIHDRFLDVSFLQACEVYRFIVVPIAEHIAGEGRIINTALPAEPDANVTVTQFHVTPVGEDAVYLDWELDEKFAKCVQYFRIVRWDGETRPIDTYTTFNDVIINGLAPCTTFEFTVTPIYNDALEGGVGVVMYETPAHSAHFPTLESVRPGVTFADMTWSLPPYPTNRCRISTFIVDGSPYINLTIPIADTPGRPPVPVHVSPLQPDSMYLFKVTMINSGGASTPVPIAIQTLPTAAIN